MKKKIISLSTYVLGLIFALPLFCNAQIAGTAKSIGKPKGYFKDVHVMEKSPLNVRTSKKEEPVEQFENNEREELERDPASRETNREHTFTDVRKISEGSLPAIPPNMSKITSQSPGYTGLGNQENGLYPSDAQIGVGPNHIVALANSDARIIDKQTGAVLSHVTLNAFFGTSGFTFDPRIFYDPYGQRFVALALLNASNDCANTVVNGMFRVLVSNTSDAMGGWYYYDIAIDATNHHGWLDFAKLGFNKDWICVCGNAYCASDGLFVLPKSAVYAGTGFTYYFWNSIWDAAPAFTYDNNLDKLYIVKTGNSNSGGTGYVDSWYISSNAQLFSSNSYGTSSWQSFATDSAHCPKQLGGPTFTAVNIKGDAMMSNCVYMGGSLWFAHAVFLPASGTTTRSSTQWWQVSPGGNSVQQVGRIDDGSGATSTYYASIGVNTLGDAVVTYSEFNATYYQSAGYNYRNASDQLGHVPNAVFYASGGSVNGAGRGGDYGQCSLEPLDFHALWLVNQVQQPSNSRWETRYALLPDYYGCYTDVTFGNNNWTGVTKNEASGSITSAEMIQSPSIVDYDAGTEVILTPGFKALQGSMFHAYIDGCGGKIGIGNKQKDSAVEKSAISEANKKEINIPALQVFPNPTTSEVNLVFTVKNDERNVLVQVFDKTGREVKQQKLNNLVKGKQSFVISLANLPSGIYNISLLLNNERLSANVVLSK